MFDNLSIKFLGYIHEPTATFILDDEIIGFHGIGISGNWIWKTANLLLQFLNEVKDRSIFPVELRNVLDKAQPFPTDFFESERSVFGEFNSTDGYGLGTTFDLLADSVDDSKSISFVNFELEGHPLNLSLKLTLDEAFYVLNNLIVYHVVPAVYIMQNLMSKEVPINYDLVQKRINLITEEDENLKGSFEKLRPFMECSIHYLKYIEGLINAKKILPLDILKTGGIRVLSALRKNAIIHEFISEIIQFVLQFEMSMKIQNTVLASFLTLIGDLDEFWWLFDFMKTPDEYKLIWDKFEIAMKKIQKPFPSFGERWFGSYPGWQGYGLDDKMLKKYFGINRNNE